MGRAVIKLGIRYRLVRAEVLDMNERRVRIFISPRNKKPIYTFDFDVSTNIHHKCSSCPLSSGCTDLCKMTIIEDLVWKFIKDQFGYHTFTLNLVSESSPK